MRWASHLKPVHAGWLFCAAFVAVGLFSGPTASPPEQPAHGIHAQASPSFTQYLPRRNSGARQKVESVNPLKEFLANEVHHLEQNSADLNFEQKAIRFQEIVDHIAFADFPEAFAHLKELHQEKASKERSELQMRLLQRWCETDAPAAAEAVVRMEINNSRLYERVAAVWSRHDQAQAVDWARQLANEIHRQAALVAIAFEQSAHDPQQALALASQTTLPPDKIDLVSRAASLWAENDPEAAVAWTRKIQDKSLHDQTLAAIATSMANTDPVGAAKLVLDSVDAGQIQESAIIGILQRIAFRDMEAATEWASEFPTSLKETAVAEIQRIHERRDMRKVIK